MSLTSSVLTSAHSSRSQRAIEVRGASCRNLQGIDLDLPRHQLVVLTGVSGSGKSSLAVQTIGAAGQRRFLETIAPRLRERLERLDPPRFDRLTGVPPVILLRGDAAAYQQDSRSTVGTLLGVDRLLAEVFAVDGQRWCPDCQQPAVAETAASLLQWLEQTHPARRVLLIAPHEPRRGSPMECLAAGFVRAIWKDELGELATLTKWPRGANPWLVIDRLRVGQGGTERWLGSLDLAFHQGQGLCRILWETESTDDSWTLSLSGKTYAYREARLAPTCPGCDQSWSPVTSRMFDRRGQATACPACWRQPAGTTCPTCHGLQLPAETLEVRWVAETWRELQRRPLRELAVVAARQSVDPMLGARLQAAVAIHAGHLSLTTPTSHLTAGQIVRLLLASATTLPLADTLFVVEEPSAGCHPDDVPAVVAALRKLLSARNSVLAVDHHPQLVSAADFVGELGPGAGEHGGRLIASGPPASVIDRGDTVSGQAARSLAAPFVARSRREPRGRIKATGHHRWGDLNWPLGTLGIINGRAGAGQSSLLDALQAAVEHHHGKLAASESPWASVSLPPGWNELQRIEANPLQQSARSTVVTWLKMFQDLRALYAESSEARLRGWGPTQFSFLSPKGGRCPVCRGLGTRLIESPTLVTESLTCPECRGTRFRAEILEAKYRGLSIHELLQHTAAEALPLFRQLPNVAGRLQGLVELGLGYLVLGQPVATLSGGEAQRLRLASRLWGRPTGAAILLMDSPSDGLHPVDVDRLAGGLTRLVELGHTVIAIDHHRRLWDAADWVVELAVQDAHPVVSFAGTPEAWQGALVIRQAASPP